ncbi:MAG: hypothetical protein WA864_21070 [Acetobacteraceae bacterium]
MLVLQPALHGGRADTFEAARMCNHDARDDMAAARAYPSHA